eukprot:jgi/Mesvir1/6218/Mv00898-RA.1
MESLNAPVKQEDAASDHPPVKVENQLSLGEGRARPEGEEERPQKQLKLSGREGANAAPAPEMNAEYRKALDGLPQSVKMALFDIFDSGKASAVDIDKRALTQLAEFTEAEGLVILDHFVGFPPNVRNKSAYLSGVMGRVRRGEIPVRGISQQKSERWAHGICTAAKFELENLIANGTIKYSDIDDRCQEYLSSLPKEVQVVGVRELVNTSLTGVRNRPAYFMSVFRRTFSEFEENNRRAAQRSVQEMRGPGPGGALPGRDLLPTNPPGFGPGASRDRFGLPLDRGVGGGGGFDDMGRGGGGGGDGFRDRGMPFGSMGGGGGDLGAGGSGGARGGLPLSDRGGLAYDRPGTFLDVDSLPLHNLGGSSGGSSARTVTREYGGFQHDARPGGGGMGMGMGASSRRLHEVERFGALGGGGGSAGALADEFPPGFRAPALMDGNAGGGMGGGMGGGGLGGSGLADRGSAGGMGGLRDAPLGSFGRGMGDLRSFGATGAGSWGSGANSLDLDLPVYNYGSSSPPRQQASSGLFGGGSGGMGGGPSYGSLYQEPAAPLMRRMGMPERDMMLARGGDGGRGGDSSDGMGEGVSNLVLLRLQRLDEDGIFPTATLDGRAWDTLRQLSEMDALAALEELEANAATDRGRVRNPSAYFTSIVCKYSTVPGRTAPEKALSGRTGYTAVSDQAFRLVLGKVAPAVADRLQRMVRDGSVDLPKLDVRALETFARLSPGEAMDMLDELSRSDINRIRNYSAYFMGMCNSHLRKEGKAAPPAAGPGPRLF